MLNWLIISYNLCRNKCEKHNNCGTEEKLHRIYYFAVVNALIGRCNNNLSGYRTDYHRYKNVHYHSASLEQSLFSFWYIISVRSSKKPCHNMFHTQIGVGNRLDGGRRRVKKYLWSFLRTAPAGAGQAVTCSTSGMGLRLK